jgi:hypothetical protein
MGVKGAEEDWSGDNFDHLLALALAHTDESMRCYEAGCPHAALVLLAAAFEAVLLGMMISNEEGLRAAERWPLRPSKLHLPELAKLARLAGWLPDEQATQVVEILSKARTMAAHPGAYVRGRRQVPDLDLSATMATPLRTKSCGRPASGCSTPSDELRHQMYRISDEPWDEIDGDLQEAFQRRRANRRRLLRGRE